MDGSEVMRTCPAREEQVAQSDLSRALASVPYAVVGEPVIISQLRTWLQNASRVKRGAEEHELHLYDWEITDLLVALAQCRFSQEPVAVIPREYPVAILSLTSLGPNK
jgi:hypothetical protein